MSSPTTENSTPGLRRAPRGFSFLDGDTPAGELTPDLSGQTLGGRFEVLRRVGKGGMGVIYIAMDRELPSRAAVKVLSSRKTGAEMRFAEEIAILANVRHPHLVAVLGAGHSAGGLPYLAMEYLEGENLEERLEGGALPWREAVELAIQVTGALTALHAAGVIHRDVKPSNVMLVESSTGQRVAKLIDLGVAKTLPALWERHRVGPQPARHQTEVGRVVGTAGYQPPEAGLAPPDPRLDVYALGHCGHGARLLRAAAGLWHGPDHGGDHQLHVHAGVLGLRLGDAGVQHRRAEPSDDRRARHVPAPLRPGSLRTVFDGLAVH